MLEVLKVIILGIVQGITEWLPISSTGHLILVEQLIQLKQNEAFTNMFNVVIQFGSILAVVVIYFHKLNPFSPTKTEKQKKMTIQLWIKVVIGTIPALIGGVLLNDLIESKLSNAYVVALMLIVYGILFIVIEKRNEKRTESKKNLSAFCEDSSSDRSFPNDGDDSWDVQIRRNDCRSTGTWGFKKCCSRVYIFPCNSGYVWSKCTEVV